MRQENIDALKMNGTVYYLDRPIEQLIPTADRPLADSAEAIKKRYEERIDIYTSTADKSITVTGVAEDAVKQLAKEHKS